MGELRESDQTGSGSCFDQGAVISPAPTTCLSSFQTGSDAAAIVDASSRG
jgi:hypothetical protein